MVFNYNLPTTSHISFQNFIYSNTHPSLPQAASTARHGLRTALKTHKRLSTREQESNLQNILHALNEYIPYLFAINDGLSGRAIKCGGGPGACEEEVDITLKEEFIVEWRPVLASLPSILKSAATIGGANKESHYESSSSSGGGGGTRIRGRGIDFEIAFVIGTLGYVLSGLARVTVLRILYASSTPTPEQRAVALQNATKFLLQASSAHTLIATSFSTPAPASLSSSFDGFTGPHNGSSYSNHSKSSHAAVPQLNTTVQTALASLALAEATLVTALKDDAYTFACIQARNPNDKEWMVRAPAIPKMRALLLARLCVRSSEYAEQAASGLGSASATSKAAKIDEDLIKYVQTVSRVARAKACRFLAVDAELASKVGEGIAWLRAGKGALGIKKALRPEGESRGKSGGALSLLKKGWSDRLDERRLEKTNSGGAIAVVQGDSLARGDDAGWDEEARVIDMLESKWVKVNNTINTHAIPPSEPLLANLPSGRDIHTAPPPYKPLSLDESELIRMRAPPDEMEAALSSLNLDDNSEEEGVLLSEKHPPAAVPGISNAPGNGYF